METTKRLMVRINDEDIKAILFRNFAGAPDKYNLNGCMANFWIVLASEEKAHELEEKRLNIAWKPNRDGDLEPRLHVFIRWDKRRPKIFQKTTHGEVMMNEDNISSLDYADISHCDLVLSPYEYDPNKPYKAYVSLAKFTIDEDWEDFYD